MSLQTRLAPLITAIGADIKSLKAGVAGGSFTGEMSGCTQISTLNAPLRSGFYNGSMMTGGPSDVTAGTWQFVQVFAHVASLNYQRQVMYDMNGSTNKVWQRWCNGGDPTLTASWSAWVSIKSGSDELAYAARAAASSTQAVASGATVDITNVTITVPASPFNVYIEGWYTGLPTAVTSVSANAGLTINEVSNGVDPTLAQSRICPTPGATSNFSIECKMRVGPTVRARTFKLTATSSGVTFAIQSSVAFPSVILAHAE